MPERIPPPPPGFRMLDDVPPPPPGFRLLDEEPAALPKVVPGTEKLGPLPGPAGASGAPMREVMTPGKVADGVSDFGSGVMRGGMSTVLSVPRLLTRVPGGLQDQLAARETPLGKRSLDGVPDLIDDSLRTQETQRDVARSVLQAEQQGLPATRESIPGKFGEMLGSTIPYLAAGPAAPVLGVVGGAEEALTRADQSGVPLSPEGRLLVGLGGAGIGSTESMPIGRLFGHLKSAGVVGKAVDENKLAQSLYPRLRDYAKSAGIQFVEEGGQEASAGIARDVLESSYGGRPTNRIGEDAATNLLGGGATGVVLDVLMKFAGSRAGRAALRSEGVDPEALRNWHKKQAEQPAAEQMVDVESAPVAPVPQLEAGQTLGRPQPGRPPKALLEKPSIAAEPVGGRPADPDPYAPREIEVDGKTITLTRSPDGTYRGVETAREEVPAPPPGFTMVEPTADVQEEAGAALETVPDVRVPDVRSRTSTANRPESNAASPTQESIQEGTEPSRTERTAPPSDSPQPQSTAEEPKSTPVEKPAENAEPEDDPWASFADDLSQAGVSIPHMRNSFKKNFGLDIEKEVREGRFGTASITVEQLQDLTKRYPHKGAKPAPRKKKAKEPEVSLEDQLAASLRARGIEVPAEPTADAREEAAAPVETAPPAAPISSGGIVGRDATSKATTENSTSSNLSKEEPSGESIRRTESEAHPQPQTTAEEPKHEYSSTQVAIPGIVGKRMKEASARIPDADLAADGREAEPHVTVKYGLHGEDSAEVRNLLAGEGPIRVKFGKSSLFENDDADVLKVDVDSEDLRRLNAKIAALPNSDKHPEYKPHATIAYLKPGSGKKYAGKPVPGVSGSELTIDTLTFSGKNGEKVEIPLTGEVAKSADVQPATPSPIRTPDTAPASTSETSTDARSGSETGKSSAQPESTAELEAQLAALRKENADLTASTTGANARLIVIEKPLQGKAEAQTTPAPPKRNPFPKTVTETPAHPLPVRPRAKPELVVEGGEPIVFPPKPKGKVEVSEGSPAVEQPQSNHGVARWLEGLSEEKRDRVYAEMRSFDSEAQRANEEHQRLSPRYGEVAAGGSHMDSFFKAEGIRAFLSELGKGSTPSEAARVGNEAANYAIEKWNQRKDVNYQTQRPADMERPRLQDMARRMDAISNDKAKEEVGEQPKLARAPRTTPALGTAERQNLEREYKAANEERDAHWDKQRALEKEHSATKYGTKKREALEKKLEQSRDKERALNDKVEPLRKQSYRAMLEDATENDSNPAMQIGAQYKLGELDQKRQDYRKTLEQVTEIISGRVDAAERTYDAREEIAALLPSVNQQARKEAVESLARSIMEHPLTATDIDKALSGRLHGERIRSYRQAAEGLLDESIERYKKATGIIAGGDRAFADVRRRINDAYDIRQIDEAVASAKKIADDAVEAKEAEAEGLKAQAVERSRTARPLSSVPVPKPNQKLEASKVWRGNLVEGGDFVSDGAVMIPVSEIPKKQAEKYTRPQEGVRTAPADKSRDLWGKVTEKATKPLTEVGVIRPGHVDFAIYELPAGDLVSLAADRVRLVQSLVNPTEIRGASSKDAVVFYRDGRPVAVLMPYGKAPDLDVKVARESAASWKSESSPEAGFATPELFGAHLIARGIVKIEAWVKAMVERYGPEIRKRALAIYREAKRLAKDESGSLNLRENGGMDERETRIRFDAIVKRGEYENYGLRAVKSLSDSYTESYLTKKNLPLKAPRLKVGEVAPESFRWEDNDTTDEKLDGTSAIQYGGDWPWETLKNHYASQQVALLGSNDVRSGDDDGEIVMRKATVLAVWDRTDGLLDEVKRLWKDEQGTLDLGALRDSGAARMVKDAYDVALKPLGARIKDESPRLASMLQHARDVGDVMAGGFLNRLIDAKLNKLTKIEQSMLVAVLEGKMKRAPQKVVDAYRVIRNLETDVTAIAQSLDVDPAKVLPRKYDQDAARSIPHQFAAAGEKLAQMAEFGKDNAELKKILKALGDVGGNPQQVKEWVERVFKGVDEGKTKEEKVTRFIRALQTAKLGLAFVPNASQAILNVTPASDFRALWAGYKALLSAEGRRFAVESGAAIDPVLAEAHQELGLGWLTQKFMTPFRLVEQHNRVVAASAGADFAARLWKMAQSDTKKGKWASRRLADLGVDASKPLTRADILMAAKKFTDQTQFRSRPENLPAWSTTPWGRVFFQFKTFSYQQARFTLDQTIGEFTRGEKLRAGRNFAMFALLGGGLGELIRLLRNLLTGKEDDPEWMERVAKAMASAGAVGIMLDATQAMERGKELEWLAGPGADMGIAASRLGWTWLNPSKDLDEKIEATKKFGYRHMPLGSVARGVEERLQ